MCPADSEKFWKMGQELARARVPDEIVRAIRIGRLTALQKESGGVRGIIAGDIVRRLVARTVAQQLESAVEIATAPFQYALSTRAGSECVAHVLQTLTDVDPSATILSVDGIGAFDLVSRETMLRGLLTVESGESALPFVRQFYGSVSTYLWQDDEGIVHDVHQGEGGEQGDALMPALFALGQHQALVAVHDQLTPQERLFAFHDDIFAVCSPERVSDIHNMLQRELWIHSRIQVHQGKTQLWNRGGVEPRGWELLAATAVRSDPDAIVWKGDPSLPADQQGVKVLGTPLGSPEYVQAMLERLSASHQRLIDRIPHITDLQSAYLLLLFCAASRPNYILRVVHPQATRAFAARHDVSMRRCMEILLDVSITNHTWDIGSLPLHMGGLGIRSAVRSRAAAFWSSWADGLSMIRRRHGPVAELIVRELSVEHPVFHLAGVVAARDRLTEMGFVAPGWEALANGERSDVNSLDDAAPGVPKHGWQHKAAQKADDFFMSTSVWPRLQESSRALLRSQGLPLSGLPFTCCPTSFHSRFEAQLFRVLLLRRLWLPLPPTSRSCRCGRPLDALGHHRAACQNVGVLGRRGFALESAAARVCREPGGRVSVNVAVRDLDIGLPNEADARRLEVVVDGLPLFHGASLGWTPLSCLCCAGTGHLTLGVQTKMEQLWQLLAAARKRAILNWLVNTGAPGWWSSPAKLVGVGQRSVANFSACWPRLRCAASQKSCGPEPNKRGSSGGVPFLLAPPHVRVPCLSSSGVVAWGQMVRHHRQMTWSGRRVFPHLDVRFT